MKGQDGPGSVESDDEFKTRLRSTLRDEMGKAKAEQYREIARLRQVNRDLTREVQSFTRDPARVEAIAREELGLVKPGEVVYQFGVGRPTPALRTAPR